MAVIKYRGLVLKEYASGDFNKHLVLLTKKKGRIFVTARGAKKQNSQLLAAAQPFTWADFLVHERGGFLSVTQADILDSFYPLRQDINKLSYCAFLGELAEKTIPEGIEADRILLLLLRTFRLLSRTNYNPKQASCVFLLRYLLLMGLSPSLSSCPQCGKPVLADNFFSFRLGGFLCNNCIKLVKDAVSLPLGTKTAMEYILSTEDSRIYSFELSTALLTTLWITLKKYLLLHTDTALPTLDFINSLEEIDGISFFSS